MDLVYWLLALSYVFIILIGAGLFYLWVEVKSSLKSTHQVTMVGTKANDVEFEKLTKDQMEAMTKNPYDNII